MVWENKEGLNIPLLYGLHLAGTSLSILGTLWTSYIYYNSKVRDNVSLKLIFAMTLSDFFYSIANFLTTFDGHERGPICFLDGFIRVCSFSLSVYFATCLAIHCLKTIMYGNSFDQESFFIKCLMVGVVMCIWLTSAPLLVDNIKYQNGEVCCDVIVTTPLDFSQYMFSLLHTAIPIMVGFFITLVCYVWTVIIIKKMADRISYEVNSDIYKLFWYPGVLFVIFAPTLTQIWTINYFYDSDDSSILQYVQFGFTRSIGFIHAIIYGLQMKSFFKKKEIAESEGDELLTESMTGGKRISAN